MLIGGIINSIDPAANMASTDTSQKNDMTNTIRHAVCKMIARTAVKKNKGKQFTIDEQKCHDFIDQQMVIVPHPSSCTEGVIYGEMTIARNGTLYPIKVPISHESVGIIGTVVPGVGNIIGAAVGGSIGGIIGGVGLGAAGAGIGAGVGAVVGSGSAAAHVALHPITLTIQEIFSESQ